MPELDPQHEDHPATVSRTARVGLVLFLFYSALYAGFLLLNIFAPGAMRETAIPLQPLHPGVDAQDVFHLDLHGLNLALVYGFALIIVAIVLAFLYMRWVRPPRR